MRVLSQILYAAFMSLGFWQCSNETGGQNNDPTSTQVQFSSSLITTENVVETIASFEALLAEDAPLVVMGTGEEISAVFYAEKETSVYKESAFRTLACKVPIGTQFLITNQNDDMYRVRVDRTPSEFNCPKDIVHGFIQRETLETPSEELLTRFPFLKQHVLAVDVPIYRKAIPENSYPTDRPVCIIAKGNQVLESSAHPLSLQMPKTPSCPSDLLQGFVENKPGMWME